MDFAQWLTANGYDAESLTKPENAKMRSHLESAWKAETQKPVPVAVPVAASSGGGFEAEMQAIERETTRVESIRELTSAACKRFVGDRQKLDNFKSLCEKAIGDPKCDVRDFQLAMLRTERTMGPIISAPAAQHHTNEILECAIALSYKLPNVEKHYSEQTLDAASRQFKHGLPLRRLLTLGARANGHRGEDSDWYTLAKAACRVPEDSHEMRADVGVSTGVQVPGILSNIANKRMASSFSMTEQSWREISAIKPVTDFKQVTTYRMGGNNTFLRVAPTGELKHGALNESSYTNQAKTFGRILGISREDIINDDLGAFMSVSKELGRGAGDALNNLFWAAFLDDSAFFPTDNSLLNYDDGATDSVLSLAGLDNAESKFALQTKPDGTPLAATLKIILVPSALKNTALTLMNSTITNMATSSVALTGNGNVFAGRYKVVSSAYLSRTSLKDENGVLQTVTGTSTAWWMLCDPEDIAVIEVVFLNGRDTPIVESEDFTFDRLGMATRAYFDFGISKQEYRGGYKLKGAA